MRLTANQVVLLLAVYRGTEVDETEVGTYASDVLRLKELGLIEPMPDVEGPGHRTTQKGDELVDKLCAVLDFPPQHPTRITTDRPEFSHLVVSESPSGPQIDDRHPFYLVANCSVEGHCLPRPPRQVFGAERDANARAIELASQVRGVNFAVMKTLAVYRVDPVSMEPVRRFD